MNHSQNKDTWKSDASGFVVLANAIGVLCLLFFPLGHDYHDGPWRTAVYAIEYGRVFLPLLFLLVTPVVCGVCAYRQSDRMKPAPALGGGIAVCAALLLSLAYIEWEHIANSHGSFLGIPLGMKPTLGFAYYVLLAAGIVSLASSLFIACPLHKRADT